MAKIELQYGRNLLFGATLFRQLCILLHTLAPDSSVLLKQSKMDLLLFIVTLIKGSYFMHLQRSNQVVKIMGLRVTVINTLALLLFLFCLYSDLQLPPYL